MRIPVERLIDGVVQTLIESVLPDLATPFARGQLYAAADVLRNLRDRVEARADLATAESDSAAAALEEAIAVLDGVDPTRVPVEKTRVPREAAADVADRVRAALASAPAAPPAVRQDALRAALVETLAASALLPDDLARAVRAPIARHLGAQAMRDVAVLKPSMLGEISRG